MPSPLAKCISYHSLRHLAETGTQKTGGDRGVLQSARCWLAPVASDALASVPLHSCSAWHSATSCPLDQHPWAAGTHMHPAACTSRPAVPVSSVRSVCRQSSRDTAHNVEINRSRASSDQWAELWATCVCAQSTAVAAVRVQSKALVAVWHHQRARRPRCPVVRLESCRTHL